MKYAIIGAGQYSFEGGYYHTYSLYYQGQSTNTPTNTNASQTSLFYGGAHLSGTATYTDDDADGFTSMVPSPVATEADTSYRRLKVAVTLELAFNTRLCGFEVPFNAPLHPVNAHPVLGFAVNDTDVPATNCEPDGDT